MPRVGEIFREEREHQGLALRDIEEVTSIRLKYLEAIENGDENVLPGEVYAKGFVRNYAIALGLDGDEFVSMYKLELGQANIPEPAPKAAPEERVQAAAEVPVIPVQDFNQEPVQIRKTTAEKRTEPKRKWPSVLLLILVFIVAVLVGVYVMLNFFYDSTQGTVPTPANPARQTTETKADKGGNAAMPPANNADKPTFRLINDMRGNITIVPPDNGKVEQIEVSASFKGECWARVVSDGKQVFSGKLNAGATQKWQGKENFRIRFGNISAVELTVNGQKLERIADSGPVVDVNISILQ